MKRMFFIAAAISAAAILSGCVKQVESGLNDASKRYFDAWLSNHYPDAERIEPGLYRIGCKPGTGVAASSYQEFPYVRIEYTSTDLEGTISASTKEQVAKQLGTYKTGNYYGPKVLYRGPNGVTAGLDAAISSMKMGEESTFVIPGWLTSYTRYDKEDDYLKEVSGSDAIYTIKLKQVIQDIEKWELDSIARYASVHMPGIDTTKYGFYYKQTKAPYETDYDMTGSEVKINYIGRLLDGTVFDTSIKDTARVWGVYDATRTYGPVKITYAEEYTDMVMGDASEGNMIKGFAYALSKMQPGEKGFCVFYSGLGYESSGSGESIPGYCPLMFELEIASVK